MQRVNGGKAYEIWTFVKANVFFAMMTEGKRDSERGERAAIASSLQDRRGGQVCGR